MKKIEAYKIITEIENAGKGDIVIFENIKITGKIDLNYKKKYECDIYFRNCEIESLDIPSIDFIGIVEIGNSVIHEINTIFTYFEKGLYIYNSVFHSELSFEAGAHNLEPIILLKNTFNKFVSFTDAWFKERAVIACNTFNGGTNLFGKEENLSPFFEKGIIAFDNTGDMKVNLW